MNHICFNGKILPADGPVLQATNRGYRYGDGLFETMKVLDNRVLLESLHFERLFSGLDLLKISLPAHITPATLREKILGLCTKNQCEKLARVRLSVSRGNGGLYEGNPAADYLIECWPLDNSFNEINENGLVIGVYPDARKACDPFSRLKSANAQPYVMAALYAKEQQWNDCLVLNTDGNIADSTIANLFMIKGDQLLTPALSEGCIDGVMRKYLIGELQQGGNFVEETSLKKSDLLNADEVFLTNAVRGIRWVREFAGATYSNEKTLQIFYKYILKMPG